MKIKIVNNTDLSYEIIGQIVDKYLNDGDPGETQYYGKVDWFKFKVFDKIYLGQTRLMKSHLQFLIEKEKNDKL